MGRRASLGVEEKDLLLYHLPKHDCSVVQLVAWSLYWLSNPLYR